jgi:glycosyltransferase involved in cell wall biosynthesis
MILFALITSVLSILFLIAIYNYYTAPVFKLGYIKNNFNPLISVLIPARNEEENIRISLDSVVSQDYKNIEILVGNDNSSDKTPGIVDNYGGLYSNIKRIDIPILPGGWLGKNHTLHRLTCSASGEYFLFIDADVQLNKEAISAAAAYMNAAGADVVSVFPRQKLQTIGERIIVPLLNLFLLSLLPLKQVYKSEKASLSAGIGQFILIRRSAYEKIGGHKELRSKIAEDVELIRKAKKNRLKVLTMLDGGLVSCRMYKGLGEAYRGFVKNFYPGSSFGPLAFIILLSIYTSVLLLPLILIFFNSLYIIPLLLIVVLRLLITVKSWQDIKDIILHPVQIFFLLFIGLRSVFPGGRIQWKGRTI